ncbi:MAG: type II toxin-antitoxin system VapC family toxin [Betaproteobacteria bacterium]
MAGSTKATAGGTRVLIDSDVLIWLMRGNAGAGALLQQTPDWTISAVSYMELVQGCRDKAELKALQKAFKSSQHDAHRDILPLTPTISQLACTLVEKYALSHSVHMADALIAATAITHAMPLITANKKHLSVINGLQIQVFKP